MTRGSLWGPSTPIHLSQMGTPCQADSEKFGVDWKPLVPPSVETGSSYVTWLVMLMEVDSLHILLKFGDIPPVGSTVIGLRSFRRRAILKTESRLFWLNSSTLGVIGLAELTCQTYCWACNSETRSQRTTRQLNGTKSSGNVHFLPPPKGAQCKAKWGISDHFLHL